MKDLEQRILNGETNFTECELSDIAYELGSFEKGESRRWSCSVKTTFEIEGRYFQLVWEQGLTESQEDQFDNQPYEVERHEKEVTITKITYTKLNK